MAGSNQPAADHVANYAVGSDTTKSGANTFVKVSAECYDNFLSQVDKDSHLYSILAGGLIFGNGRSEGKIVKILCDQATVELLLESARILCPDAVRQIEESIRSGAVREMARS
jgi:hypothetical protein